MVSKCLEWKSSLCKYLVRNVWSFRRVKSHLKTQFNKSFMFCLVFCTGTALVNTTHETDVFSSSQIPDPLQRTLPRRIPGEMFSLYSRSHTVCLVLKVTVHLWHFLSSSSRLYVSTNILGLKRLFYIVNYKKKKKKNSWQMLLSSSRLIS